MRLCLRRANCLLCVTRTSTRTYVRTYGGLTEPVRPLTRALFLKFNTHT